jgi:hypothetical protein
MTPSEVSPSDEVERISGWIQGRLPDGWFREAPEVQMDRDEILIVGRIEGVEVSGDAALKEAEIARITRWREETRELRMGIASEAERRFERKVSWGARCGETGLLFTHLSLPVMTRLRLKERRVLDTLVDAGVARSRSHALAWCVRLVGEHESEWIDKLRSALGEVERVRAEGPA